MGRTILYVLIGVSVVGALAVLLLMTPMTEIVVPTPETAPEAPVSTDLDSTEPADPAEASADEPTEPAAEPPVVTEPAVGTQATYSIDGFIVSGEYAHEMTVAGVDVYWSNDAHRLRVALAAPGTGFVSIGFDPERQMEGANYILASMHEGELTIRDDYGTEPLAHMEDAARGGTNDVLAAAGNQWPDETVVEFIIPLDSGDEMDKPLIPGHSYTVLVAYHSMLDDFTARHTRRGTGTMQLDLPGS